MLFRSQPPYSRGLLAGVPHLLVIVTSDRPYLQEVPGMVPALSDFGFNGCMFAPGCDLAQDHCWQQKPDTIRLTSSQSAACWALGEGAVHADV